MKMKMEKYFLLIIISLLMPSVSWSEYSIPSDRVVTWTGKTGLDLVGGIPTTWANCTTTACNTLYGGTVTAATINAAIASAPANTVVRIPAGSYTVNAAIPMKSNVILRGAGAPYPWMPGGTGGTYLTSSGTSSHINFGGSPTRGSAVTVSAGATKGATTITLAAGHGIVTGNYISIYASTNPSWVNRGGCSWCGEDSGSNLMQQFAKVTGVSGNDVSVDPPLYQDYSSYAPRIKKMTFNIFNAGVEYLKFNNAGAGGPIIYMRGAVNCWVKGVETYNAGSSGKQGHIQMDWSFANEIRDSYVHDGRSNDSDRDYGIFSQFWNSATKIENNILTGVRHAVTFEGGGSGYALLYNYGANNYESDGPGALTESMTINHGSHPHMNLWEGNIDQHLWGDETWGSASHITLFRNWGLGYRSTPSFNYWQIAFTVGPWNRYYNLVGNVAGRTAWTSGTAVCSSTSECTEPIGYDFNHSTSGSATDSTNPYTTSINHGNYNYVSDSVTLWQGGADHTLPNSIYYISLPSSYWCAETPWPPIGPDVSGLTNDIPAKRRYEGAVCTGAAPPSGRTPFPPGIQGVQ